MNFRKWTLRALFKGTVQWGGKDWFGHDSLLQNSVVPFPTLIGEKKKRKKDPQATTHTYLNLKFTLPSCFQRGKKCSHHKCKKGTMQARWNTVYIMHHSLYFMLYFHWLKTGTRYTWFSMLFSSYHLPCNWSAIFFQNELLLIENRRMLMYPFQSYKKSNFENQPLHTQEKPQLWAHHFPQPTCSLTMPFCHKWERWL